MENFNNKFDETDIVDIIEWNRMVLAAAMLDTMTLTSPLSSNKVFWI